jgi:hypothetical protein
MIEFHMSWSLPFGLEGNCRAPRTQIGSATAQWGLRLPLRNRWKTEQLDIVRSADADQSEGAAGREGRTGAWQCAAH